MSNVQDFIGGNTLETAAPGLVREFVASSGGHTVITKVLIANNGIAAVKEIRSVRKWAYETFGNERAIEFTVMATPEDLKVNAEYIRMADQYVEVPGGTNNNNYANVDLIIDIAERTGVHAIWAGWGHASENPRLPELLRLSKNKTVFIGPPGSAMRSLGDKISSTIVAQSARVPTLGWSGNGLSETMTTKEGFLSVPEDVYQKACVVSAEQGLERAMEIGFPVMIKASEGGGGKGIRKVEAPEGFTQAYHQVLGEVPGSPIFIMKLAGDSRHLEVQLLADQYGNAISLFGRDCSVQRRHQKIIEEAPVTIANADTFEEMEKAAVRLAKLVGYVSAGTVEYLYSHSDNQFYFLELNPRLQVEHPTTEMVSGVNLPAAQLQIAMGIPLHRIRDIRLLYGLAPGGTSEIDFEFATKESFETQRKPAPKGHVIAVRITAENPDAGFKPSSGMMEELNFRSSTNVWGYFSLSSAGGLHEFADSQFGHIFSYGADRQQARKNMVVALKEMSIRGEFRTTVEYLIKLLETEAFEHNTVNTGWLDTLISKKLTAERPPTTLAIICGAVYKAHSQSQEKIREFKRSLEKGQVLGKEFLSSAFTVDFILDGVRYKFTVTRVSHDSYVLYINGSKTQVSVRALTDGGLLVLLDGRSHTIYTKEEVQATRMMVDGKTCLLEQENDPTQLRSPSPGKLVRYLVEPGGHLKSGDAYAEIEVMKMYMPLVASEDGVVQFIKQPGSTLGPGDIIGILTLDDPSRVRHAKLFEGQIPPMGPPLVIGDKVHQRFREIKHSLDLILDGYDSQGPVKATIKQLLECLQDGEVAFHQFNEVISALSGRMPAKLEADLHQSVDQAQKRHDTFPASNLLQLINSHCSNTLQQAEAATFRASIAPVIDVVTAYVGGPQAYQRRVICELLTKYHDVEIVFDDDTKRQEEAILSLRDGHKDDLDFVVNLVQSHWKVAGKNQLVIALLEEIRPHGVGGTLDKCYTPILKDLSELSSRHTAKVALLAKEMLIQTQLPSYEERMAQMERILKSAVTDTIYGIGEEEYRTPSYASIEDLIVTNYFMFDVLQNFFYHENKWIALAAIEVYCRRSYHAYDIYDTVYHTEQTPFIFEWNFELHDSTRNGAQGNRISSQRNLSISDMTFMQQTPGDATIRRGAMGAFQTFEELEAHFERVLSVFSLIEPSSTAPRNILSLALQVPASEEVNDQEWVQRLERFLQSNGAPLRERGIRRITFLLNREGTTPAFFTFLEKNNYTENQTIRHIEPALAYQLELNRLTNFDITPCFSENRNIHIYYAVGKENISDCRFFVRVLVRPGRLRSNLQTADYLVSESDRLLKDILDALEIVSSTYKNSDCNHLFINFIPTFVLEPEQVESALTGFIDRHGKRLWRQRVTGAEIRFNVQTSKSENPIPVRFTISNVSGFVLKMETYTEEKNSAGEVIYKSLGTPGSMHLQPISSKYQTKEWLQPRRYKAHVLGTAYAYDFPELVRQSVRNAWTKAAAQDPTIRIPKDLLNAKELVLDDNNEIHELYRSPGSNNCGMVAWKFEIFTPEYPQGRQVIAIANDITFITGSFGVAEDMVFYKASELARKLGIPRIYFSANSGARIGLAEEVKSMFRTAWTDPADVSKGFKYLYLTPKEYEDLNSGGQKVVFGQEIEEDGERRYVITDVIGATNGLGVENLRGSGMIAGETSRAYDDIFTVTLVSCRSVGIGAYLVRLGQRTIQNEGQPILLTGAAALNKVLGREVYSSNLQLGGTQIMYRNGVTHNTALNDLDGVGKIIDWLSFVPARRGDLLPITRTLDPVDRDITYTPPKGPSDPRDFLQGKYEDNEWLSGFFDKDSFVETLGGWARTVVTGRARLGGIPMGVIAVETRTVEHIIPADPANASSEEQVLVEAGGVWYPNSAYKTAQAINDFNKGEQLPLIIFANWRGFSGGQRDMYNEVLKFGSHIVDALANYKQPAFVYIIPNGELRGGAWVVLDPTINSDMMEMYADNKAKAGVLEPEGIVEIKFRKPHLLAAMERLDEKYRELKQQLNSSETTIQQKAELTQQLEGREKELLPVYSQIAVHFADLHDTPGRMKAKGTIREILEWKNARRFFYWRVSRRVHEEHWLGRMMRTNSDLSREDCFAHLRQWFAQDTQCPREAWDDSDEVVSQWLSQSPQCIEQRLQRLRQPFVVKKMVDLAQSDRSAAMDGLLEIFGTLSTAEKELLLRRLTNPTD
ncbi:acetyl-CoA carboxylase [Basidiobolus meristosporus CBS 931.73]|uniref:Acetyl-CoA carboxylase n=1 Tax=Basidiobolus meristosporus CBS 931.73 TaxID=1314790 RepID=A0A1Y1Y009_9FUNG|nr:acetyl-CoA carboxylase [Basidiobolus meristosporus CBS 931.73]|eukprot:ORX91331.1 acetyl-CoA carboxylase [Basidiobolus meristosporus CBS 931.73]